MTNEELKLLLQDHLKRLSVDEMDLYKAVQNLIQTLDKQPKAKPAGMIERCVFCGQVIPSRKAGGKH